MANSSTGDFILGLLVGGAIGVTCGLLYAPRPGAESRSILRKQASDLKERVEGFGPAFKEGAETFRRSIEENLPK